MLKHLGEFFNYIVDFYVTPDEGRWFYDLDVNQDHKIKTKKLISSFNVYFLR